MQCKCGDEINNEIREIKTNAKAKEWMDGKDVVAPVILNHYRCSGCGREARIIEDMDGLEIYRKGI